MTYQRRYAICSILGIVADMDMDGAMLEEPKAEPAKPAPKKTVTKKKAPVKAAAESLAEATAGTVIDPADQPLMKEEVEFILDTLGVLHKAKDPKFNKIETEFRETFKIAADCRLSESITTQAHLAFINERI